MTGGMKLLVHDFLSARRLQGELTSALHAQDFVLHVQPVVELTSGRIVAAEALIRWNHLERGLLLPAEFVPFAEDRGLLPSIGAWVIGEAVAVAAGLRAIEPSFRVWFNASVPELGDPRWLERIASFGDSLHGLGVEITESVAMRDLPGTLRTLAALKQAGLSIALDDFGTGYSSLAQLKQLPVDVVKLDRAFIAGFPGDPRDREIVGAILSIGRRFGFETVAEGIETAEQARALRDAGCRYGQGYHLGRPMPIEALVAIVQQRRPIAS
jgi:EAL domain-containing protein (putative c-di-GMP-specific phosphodiesterase class I)